MRKHAQAALAVWFAVLLGASVGAQSAGALEQTGPLTAAGTAFTYQGTLNDNGAPASGSFDFQFALFDALTGGSQVGATLSVTLTVTGGLFETALDFGAGPFAGQARWLEIAVRPSGGSGGNYTTLSPRQPLYPVPYAICSESGVATDVACSGCVGSTDIASATVVRAVNGLHDNVTLAPGTNIAITPSGSTLTIAMTGVPGGTLPGGAASQTLYSNGSGWLATNALTNNGTNIGITNNLLLPNTASGGASGVSELGGNPFIHNYGGTASTFIGSLAGNFTVTGVDNTGVGASSLASVTTGFSNTALGAGSLLSDTTGTGNVALGLFSMASNISASQNTAVGLGALASQSFDPGSSWDSDNTAVGYNALNANQPTNTGDGIQNTAVGSQVLQANTNGSGNTATGFKALSANVTGALNTADGYLALHLSTGGLANTALGAYAGSGYQGGSFNVAVGQTAGATTTSGNYNIDIGNSGGVGDSGTTRIGDSNETRTFISGIRGVTTGLANAIPVVIDGAGQLGTVSSSIRFKRDVADMGDASSRLMELRPVTFHYKSQPDGPLQFGLIAEEVDKVMPELVVRDASGQIETVAYHELPAMLLNEMQKQQATIKAQQAKIDDQTREIAALKAQLAARDQAIERRLAALEQQAR